MPPKLALSISELEDQNSVQIQYQSTARYGEPARRHVSPYGSAETHVALNPLHPSHQSSPYISPFASPSPRSHQAPYMSQSPARTESTGEQSLSNHRHLDPATPIKCESLNGDMDTPLPPPSSKGLKRSVQPPISGTAPAAKKFKGEAYYTDVERLLETENSPLYKDETNLKMILQHPLAQAYFTTTQSTLQLPNTYSDEFASAVASFKDDGRSGRHDQEWVAQAEAAGIRRRAGAFDEYDKEQFEKHWSADSAHLSEDESRKSSPNGCGDDCDNKSKHQDHFDDDDNQNGDRKTVGYGHSYPASGSDHGNSNRGKSSSDVSDSKYNGANGNNQHALYNQIIPSVFNANTKHFNTVKLEIDTKDFYLDLSTLPYLPTLAIVLIRPSFGSFHSPINHQTCQSLRLRTQNEHSWLDRGYCDAPNSVYPPLDGSLFNFGYLYA